MFERFYRPPAGSYFLFGPRGTGKSTSLRERYPDALFVDLIDPENTRFYDARPERLRDTIAASPARRRIVIDEVQRVPELLQVVHQLIELDKRLRFVLTGSSARKLRRTGVDLLAGRAALTTMHPFMAAELGAGFNLDRALSQGLIPLVVDAAEPDVVLRSYAALYVREEVQAEGLVRNVGAFSRFLEAVSFSHAAVLNVSNLARECQVERKVAEGYVDVLRDLLLAFTLPVFTRRARRRMTTHPKLYLVDAGLFRSLRPTGPFDRPEELAGAALEGLVAQHLRAWIAYSNRDDALSFWRTRAGNEVDFVLYGESGLFAIEVKDSATLHPRDFSGLRAFTQDYPIATPVLLYRGSRRIQERGVLCLPCEPFLRTLTPARSFSQVLAAVPEP
ncbi:MAG: ATP-binding protein [Spirochaetaceae bacterium]|nr:ATP-binding protein [Spirochaetaceae bacterium]